MRLFSWLREQMTARPRTHRAPATRPTPLFRPRLELLERRDVLSFGSPVHIGHNAGFASTIRSNTDYTEVVTTSNLILDGTLILDIEGAPTPGAVLTIMSGKKIVGTFTNLPEGSTVSAGGGQRFRISYRGNNVTLTALGTQRLSAIASP